MFNFNDKNKVEATKQLDERIKLLKKEYAKTKLTPAFLSESLIMATEHAIAYKDSTKLTALWDLTPASMNKPYMGDWIKKNTTLVYRKNAVGDFMWLGKEENGKKLWNFTTNDYDQPGKEFYNIDGANDPKPDTWNLFTALENILSKAQSRMKDKAKNPLSQPEREALARLMPAYEEISRIPHGKQQMTVKGGVIDRASGQPVEAKPVARAENQIVAPRQRKQVKAVEAKPEAKAA